MRKTGARLHGKVPEVKVHRERPYNAETGPALLRRSFVTPVEAFYARNHGNIPGVNARSYRLEVGGLVEEPLRLSLGEIKRQFPRRELTATLYCAGNRRRELMELPGIPSGKVPWGGGAAGNARWAGASLRAVLLAAGVGKGARHAAFVGMDMDEESDTKSYFGGSIPIEKAMSKDVLLAYEMNGEPLPTEHGFPLRVVAGGYIGARSVKWLSSITLQENPSDNYYQACEYKIFPLHMTPENVDHSQGRMLGEIPLNAVICVPEEDETVEPGAVSVRGYAIVGERHVERVEVSADEGETWTGADLAEGAQHPLAWRFWEAEVSLEPGSRRILARAVDSASCTQPESVGDVWNFQGYANNAYHAVNVRCGGTEE